MFLAVISLFSGDNFGAHYVTIIPNTQLLSPSVGLNYGEYIGSISIRIRAPMAPNPNSMILDQFEMRMAWSTSSTCTT